MRAAESFHGVLAAATGAPVVSAFGHAAQPFQRRRISCSGQLAATEPIASRSLRRFSSDLSAPIMTAALRATPIGV